jgi:hypothetical protein
MDGYKRRRIAVIPGTRAKCEGCGTPAAYMVNSIAWMLKERDLCPECAGTAAAEKCLAAFRGALSE